MTTQAWLLEIEYKNRLGKIVKLKEYHLNYDVAYNRLNSLSDKLQVVRVSIKQEHNRGEAQNDTTNT